MVLIAPDLKSPHNGPDIIFNTVPFPGSISKAC